MKAILKGIFSIRVIVSFFVFSILCIYFLDLNHTLPKSFYKFGAIRLEIAPALCKWIVGGTVATSFIIFSLLSLFFGRIYCSCFCPFGILSDISRFFARIFFKLPFFNKSPLFKNLRSNLNNLKFAKAKNFLRAICLCLAIFFYAIGASALLGMLEPFSLFGKIASDFFRPLAILFNSAFSNIFGENLFPKVIDPSLVSATSFAIGSTLFLLIFTASVLRGRIFCNTLCPVGAWLGFLSRFSIFKLTLSQDCVKCGKCLKNCRAQCIDLKTKKLDFSRCVMCGDCLSGCPKSAINFEFTYKKFFSPKNEATLESQNSANNISRKTFAKTLIAGAGTLSIAAISKNDDKEIFCVPAGSQGVDEFTSRCIACGLCIASCKGNVLQPSISQWGLSGFMIPYMDFSTGYCKDDCHNCTKVCPSGAISFLTKAQKLEIKIGRARIDYDKCIIVKENKTCTVCEDACPQKAIEFRPRGNSNRKKLPKVMNAMCIGCGKCAYLCPAKPKAIKIDALQKHIKN